MKALLAIVVVLAFCSAGLLAYMQVTSPRDGSSVACTMEAKICPDGSSVGRVGPDCEFAPCPTAEDTTSTDDGGIGAQIEQKAHLIVLTSPAPFEIITSPLTITGKARGTWYFEGSFPVVLVDWDGKIVAEGIATAQGDWMTEDFVPFTATLTFTKPEMGAHGSLILKKDNPSGLPEHDDALEVPILFDKEELIPV